MHVWLTLIIGAAITPDASPSPIVMVMLVLSKSRPGVAIVSPADRDIDDAIASYVTTILPVISF